MYFVKYMHTSHVIKSKEFPRKYQQVRYGKEINCAIVMRDRRFLVLKIRERYAASERSCFLFSFNAARR